MALWKFSANWAIVCPFDKSTTSLGTMFDENEGAHRALIFASTWEVIIRISALLSSGDTLTKLLGHVLLFLYSLLIYPQFNLL